VVETVHASLHLSFGLTTFHVFLHFVVVVIFVIRFFVMEPDAMAVLGFPSDMDPTSKEVQDSPRFKAHSKFFVELLDRALDMIGPAHDVLTDILDELGQSHSKMGVKPQFFPALGVALIELLGESLPKDIFTDDVKAAWVEVYTALSSDMIRSVMKANSQ
jgi:Globin